MIPARWTRRAVLVLSIALCAGSSSAQATAAPAGLAEWAAAVASSDPAKAWPALNALRTFDADADPRARKEAQKLAATWTAELKSLREPNARVLRAHALGALRALGEPGAAALADGCGRDSTASVRLACALALAEIGEGAQKASARVLRPDDLLGGALACAVLGRPGPRSSYVSKTLRDAAGNVATFREFVLAESALTALETLGEDVQKLREDREKQRGKLSIPTEGGVNWNGLGEQVPETFFEVFREALAAREGLNDFAKPAKLRPVPNPHHLYDMYAEALAHLTRIDAELLPDLEKGAFATFHDYAKRTRPWMLTTDILLRIEERFMPLGEKKK